jgi:hypothetical protein
MGRFMNLALTPPSTNRMLKIFISFSTADGQDLAGHIYRRYNKKDGYKIFFSPKEIQYGVEGKKEIKKNIEECNIFLLIATQGALESEEVAEEVTEARLLGKQIIPCIPEDVEWSHLKKWGIDSIQGVEFTNAYELARKIHPIILQQSGVTLAHAQRKNLALNETRFDSGEYEPSLRARSGGRIPSAYIGIDGKLSKLQLEHEPMSQDRVGYYDRRPQGTISFGDHFRLIIPQTPSKFKKVESARLWVNDDIYNENDYLQIDIELVNVIDGRFSYIETYLNGIPSGGNPNALGDGYTANEKGFKIFLWWEVHFTDGTDQTYLAIVRLRGDKCEKYGWDNHPTDNTRCIDLDA